jgi:hypothetical protein
MIEPEQGVAIFIRPHGEEARVPVRRIQSRGT